MQTSFDAINEFALGVVIAVDEENNQIEVLFSGMDDPELFNANQVINIEREYKVISINENKDIRTKVPSVIIEMSRIDKLYINTGNGYMVTNTYGANNFDLFVYKGDSINCFDCIEICNNPQKNKIISLSEYRVSIINYDGIARSAFYSDCN